jgi:hypothetical protein
MILDMIGLDTTTRIDCRVSPRPHVWLLYCPVNCNPKAFSTLGNVSTSLHAAVLQHLVSHALFSRPFLTPPLLLLRC